MQFHYRYIINFALFSWLFIYGSITQANTEVSCAACDESESSTLDSSLDLLEKTQSTLGDYVYTAGEKIDLFFGADSDDLIYRGSQLKVMFPVRFYDNGDIDTSIQFSAQLDLPRTNHRWKLFVTSYQQSMDNTPDNISTTGSSTVSRGQGASSANEVGSVGLFYDLLSQNNFSSKLDFGVNLGGSTGLDPFVRLRVRHNAEITEGFNSQQTQRLFWESHKGVSWDMQQVFDYEFDDSLLLRSQTSGLWWIDGEYLELNQKLIAFNTINEDRVVAYYAYWQWDDSLSGPIRQTEVAAGINVRERLYKDWLFGEVEPRLKARVEDNFQNVEVSVLFMLEMLFYSNDAK